MYQPADLDGAPMPVLRELLASANPKERSDAACALGDRLRTRELDRYEPEVQEALAALLTDSAPMVQFEAAIALAEAHDHRATDVLLHAVRFRELRLDATRALGTLGDPAAVPALTKLMRKWLMPWADRLQAAAALCALRDAGGAAYLKDKLESRRRAESAAAVHFIGESRHPEALSILRGILENAQHALYPIRDVAVRALGLLGNAAARPALEAARKNADAELAQDIDAALAILAKLERSPAH